MNKLLLAVLLIPALALGAEEKTARADDPRDGWVPPKVKKEAKERRQAWSRADRPRTFK